MLVWMAAVQLAVPLGLDAHVPAPTINPVRRELALLGKRLFFDRGLSRNGTVSCATCHDPKYAFTDRVPRAIGIDKRQGARRTPSILNRAWGRSFFWDGRTATLEEQVLLPIGNPDEMDTTPAEAVARVRASGDYPGLTVQDMAYALATYVRTILAGDSPYDRYVRGDRSALDEVQLAGLRLFRGKAGCGVCHVGANLTDERFHNTGAGNGQDPGRWSVTRREEDRGAFKTPTLRQAALRPPYMHDGSLATIEDVIEHYDKGGSPGTANLDPDIQPLRLTKEEKQSLAAFLRALSGVVKDGME